MREIEEDQNRAGYQEELEERLALAGAAPSGDLPRRPERGETPDPDADDQEEDELEDEEALLGPRIRREE